MSANVFSNYVQDAIAKWLFKNTAPTVPATLYVAAFTAAPTNAGGGTEVSGNAYVRQAVSAGAAWTESGSSPTQITNANDILYPVCTGSWGTIVAIGIFDAASNGNLIFWGALTTNIAITNANIDQLKIPAGSLVLNVD